MKTTPFFIESLKKTDPDLHELVDRQHEITLSPGALDTKTKLLISFAIDVYAGSRGVKPLSELARKAGATETEIAECIRLAYHIAGNKVLHAAVDAFEENADSLK